MKPLNKFFFPERTFCFGAKKRRRDGSLRPGCGRQKRSGAGRGLYFFLKKTKKTAGGIREACRELHAAGASEKKIPDQK
jgi:hypothetical protein